MNSNQTTALAATGSTAVQVRMSLDGLTAIREAAAEISKSGILGEITQSQGVVSLVAMREEGLSIVGFRRKYQWVGNELSTRPQWLLGEFKRNGGKYRIVQSDADACEIHFTTKDGEEYPLRITMEQMRKTDVPFDKNGNLKKNWKNFADDMLFARVCGKGLRRVAPELFDCVYTDGEAADFDAPAPVRPAPVEIPPEQVKSRIAKLSGAKKAATPVATPVAPVAAPEPAKAEDAVIDVVAEEVAVADSEPQGDGENASPAEVAKPEPTADPAPSPAVAPAPAAPASTTPAPAAPAPSGEPALVDENGVPIACPMPGKYYGVPYAKLAKESPEIIAAILTCNREKHPELTPQHIEVVNDYADKLGLFTEF